MIKIIGGRQTGKTEKLIEYAKENNCIIIAANPGIKNEIRLKNRDIIVYCAQEIFTDNFLRRVKSDAEERNIKKINGYVFDDAEYVIDLICSKTLLPGRFMGGTINIEDSTVLEVENDSAE